jgi:hypothetical protein
MKRFTIFLTVAISISLLSACGDRQTYESHTSEPMKEQPTATPEPIEEIPTVTPEPSEETPTVTPEPTEETPTVTPEPTEDSQTDEIWWRSITITTTAPAPEDTNPYGYNMSQYSDGEDLYDDNEDDFEDEEEAEDYYDDYGE